MFSQASLITDVNFKEQHITEGNPFLSPGSFQYIDVKLTVDAEKIYIVAYSGDSLPDLEDRSPKNYYRWEYDHGVWNDVSGHDLLYLIPSKCSEENHIYSFYLSIDNKANPGHWTFKVIVDDEEVTSTSSFVATAGFNLFLSAMIGVFEPNIRNKKLLDDSDFICSDRKTITVESEKNIDVEVDKVLKRHAASEQDESRDEILDSFPLNHKPSPRNELVKSSVSTYPKSRLKKVQSNAAGSLFFSKKLGGGNDGFRLVKLGGYKKFLAIVLTIILISAIFVPVITSIGGGPPDITIINVQSYPVVGGQWTVMFTTIGTANLTITAVNGTTWSYSDETHDLKFLELRCGDEALEYEWINNSVFIANFSSDETCYETSKVLTTGIHTLVFQFGDDISFANNLASEYWLQTTTSDFNNGTINNINVSSDSFHLNETYCIRNTTLIDNESFEVATWPPNGWSATGEWNRESDQAHDGSWSADFDGFASGRTGDLDSPTMDCSDTANITAIYVDFYYRDEGAEPAEEFYLYYYDGSGWDLIEDLADDLENNWNQYTEKIIDSQYFKNNFQIRWSVTDLENGEQVYVDLVNVTLETNESGYVTDGSLISETHDTGRAVPDYTNIIVTNSTPAGTTITAWVRAADTEANLSIATWYTNINQVPDERWVQWRINLTGNEYNTSTVTEVNLTWNYDNEKPTSSVNTISPYWQNTTPFEIIAAASDTGGSGLKEVALYYNYSTDNSSGWSGWTLFGTNDTVSPYNWSFIAPSGDGYYRFYSIATDNESNVEDPPTPPSYDNISGVDTVDPQSQVEDLTPPYWKYEIDNPITINLSSASDSLSGLKNVTLWYSYSVDNSSWDPWTSYGIDTQAPWSWSFNFLDGTGHYKFYSIAKDNASNSESPPVVPNNDTQIGYSSTKPSSEVDLISPYWYNTTPLTITGQATDFSGSGLNNVTLYYYNSTDNNTWSDAWSYGVVEDPWNGISWSFNFPNSTGYYRFYSIAIDNNTNAEDFTGNDTECGYDTSSPFSQVDTIDSYWNNASDNPLTINVSSYSDDLSGLNNITLYWWNSTDNISWSGPWSNGTDPSTPYSWSFTFSNGSGYYRFYSIAQDKAGNEEAIPISNDTEGGYDTINPSSQVDTISPYWKSESDSPIIIDATTYSDDLSGMKNMTLYYKYRVDNSSGWGSWTSYGVDINSPWSWSFNFPDGEGHYAFYSIASDNASNYEDPPVSPDNDTACGYIGLNMTIHLWSENNSVSSVELTLSNSANADGSGTGTRANAVGKWSKTPYEYWDFVIENYTGILGPINNVFLYLKHNQTGWIDENFVIQIWNGSTWSDVRSYTPGDGPPTVDTTDNWDVMVLGIDTWKEIDAAIVRISGNGTNPAEETVNWYVDTVELRIEAEYPSVPVINSYDLRNATGSKLNNATGLLDVNNEYYFTVNITDETGWNNISYINITAWYDNGSEVTAYNNSENLGGNLNMFLQYENTSGVANWNMLWPKNEAEIVLGNCTEILIGETTRVINISFKPLSQVRWAGGDGAWDTTEGHNDVSSWNFNITVTDAEDDKTWKIDEYGVYKYTSITPAQNWVDVIVNPGFSDSSNIVAVTYSSNYDYNISIYFEENLTKTVGSYIIGIAGNVTILADADLNDDITSDVVFTGIGEANAVDIYNISGTFNKDGAFQIVNVQFSVYVDIGTIPGEYRARVATKISHD